MTVDIARDRATVLTLQTGRHIRRPHVSVFAECVVHSRECIGHHINVSPGLGVPQAADPPQASSIK